jgi:hypothetical protein
VLNCLFLSNILFNFRCSITSFFGYYYCCYYDEQSVFAMFEPSNNTMSNLISLATHSHMATYSDDCTNVKSIITSAAGSSAIYGYDMMKLGESKTCIVTNTYQKKCYWGACSHRFIRRKPQCAASYLSQDNLSWTSASILEIVCPTYSSARLYEALVFCF